MIVVLLAATALLTQAEPAAAPAAAAQASSTVSPAVVSGKKAPASAQDPNQIICHSEPVLGTLFPKKTCATRAQLAERTAEDQKSTREATSIRPYRDPTQ